MTLSRHTSMRPSMPSRGAFSLIELVTALAISSILVAALGSAVVVASAALPTAEGEHDRSVAGQLDWIALDISEATLVLAAEAGELTISVPDRDGDFQPEKISYTWDGVDGSPLLRTVNGGAAATAIDSIAKFVASIHTSSYTVGVNPEITRTRIDAVDLSVTSRATSGSIVRSIELANRPHQLTLWARTDFDSNDPTVIDLDHSGQSEWTSDAAFDTGLVSNGWWKAEKNNLSVRNPGNMNEPVTISARVHVKNDMRNASITAKVDVGTFMAGVLKLTVTANAKDQTVLLENFEGFAYKSLRSTTVATGPVDVTLAIEPASNTVSLFINGVYAGEDTYTRSLSLAAGSVRFDMASVEVCYDWIDVRIGGSSP